MPLNDNSFDHLGWEPTCTQVTVGHFDQERTDFTGDDPEPSDHVIVKLDFTNAFNRSDILSTVESVLPELHSYYYFAYSSFSHLCHSPHWFVSGRCFAGWPARSCVVFNHYPATTGIFGYFLVPFLGWLAVGGNQKTAADCTDATLNVASKMGLHLNVSNCQRAKLLHLLAAPQLRMVSCSFFFRFWKELTIWYSTFSFWALCMTELALFGIGLQTTCTW